MEEEKGKYYEEHKEDLKEYQRHYYQKKKAMKHAEKINKEEPKKTIIKKTGTFILRFE